MNYTHEDFEYSAKKKVDEFFNSANYPVRKSFTEDEMLHIYMIATSILMTKHNFQVGGSFVQAVVGNKLCEAYERADNTMIRAMRVMTYVANYASMVKMDPNFVKM